jgi:hypothetical protein
VWCQASCLIVKGRAGFPLLGETSVTWRAEQSDSQNFIARSIASVLIITGLLTTCPLNERPLPDVTLGVRDFKSRPVPIYGFANVVRALHTEMLCLAEFYEF